MKKHIIVSGINVKSATGEESILGGLGILEFKDDVPVSLNFRPTIPADALTGNVSIEYFTGNGLPKETLEKFAHVASQDGALFYGLENSGAENKIHSESLTLLPGIELLGNSIPVGGDYSTKNIKNTVFDFSNAPTREVSFNGKTYLCFAGLNGTSSTSEATGEARFFSSRSEVTGFFNSKAKIEGSAGGFNAEFSAQFTECNEKSAEYSYSIYDMEARLGFVNIKDVTDTSFLASGLKENRDYKALPDSFTKENASLWYTFFQSYGTQIISKIHLGGKLYYYSYISKEHSMSSEETKLACKLSYESLFYKTSAEAEASWKKVNKNYTENAVTRAISQGGKPFAIPDTSSGANYHEKFEAWKDSLVDNPYAASFEVVGIDKIFSGSKAAACRAAITAYTNLQVLVNSVTNKQKDNTAQHAPEIQLQGKSLHNNLVLVEVQSVCNLSGENTNPAIIFNGEKIAHGEFTKDNNYWLVVINPDRMRVMESIIFEHDFNRPEYFKDTIYPKLKRYMNGRNILAVATKTVNSFQLPQGDFYNFLMDCGAGDRLQAMEKHQKDTGSYLWWNYSLVGVMGIRVTMSEMATPVSHTTSGVITSVMPPCYRAGYIDCIYGAFNNYRAVVVNNKSTVVELDVSWSANIATSSPNYFKKFIGPLFEKFKSNGYTLICTTYNIDSFLIPQGEFYSFLRDCGAGDQLAEMEKHFKDTNQYVNWRYSLVGLFKSTANTGMEISESTSGAKGEAYIKTVLPAIVMLPNYQIGDEYGFKPAYL